MPRGVPDARVGPVVTLGSRNAPRPWPPLAMGFRPFFFLAAWAAVALTAVWLAALGGQMAAPVGPWGTPFAWHGHEMLFGFAAAVVAGFLLTAVRNWTGMQTLQGGPLAALAGVWVVGRLTSVLASPGDWAPAALPDLVFAAGLAAAIARPIARRRNRRNYRMPVYVALLGVGHGLAAAGAALPDPALVRAGWGLGLAAVLVLLTAIGGRVLPFFTRRRLDGFEPRRVAWAERVAEPAVLAWGAAVAFGWVRLAALAAAVAAAAHAARTWGWWTPRVWRVPLLWVLHLGYAWLAVGFGLEAAALLGGPPSWTARHALTAGAIGTMTLGMMARVALGHTGRPLRAPRAARVAFVLVHLGAALRVFGPLLAPAGTSHALLTGGLLWAGAFASYALYYTPILLRPRADGRPG